MKSCNIWFEIVLTLKFANLVIPGVHMVKVPGGRRADGLHAGHVGEGAGRGEVGGVDVL